MARVWRSKCLDAARDFLMGLRAAEPVAARVTSPAMSFAMLAAQQRERSPGGRQAQHREDGCPWGGCFAAGTRIRLANGTSTPIEELVPGASNISRQDGTATTMVAGAVGDHCLLLYRLVTELGAQLAVTAYHPMVVRRNGLLTVVPARDLFLGEEIPVYDEDRRQWSLQMVLAKLRTPNAGQVYNLELDGNSRAENHFLVANGIMAGDLFLQRQLEQRLHLDRPVQRLEIRGGDAAA